MTILYYDPVFQEHDTGSHPESPARLRSIDQLLGQSQTLRHCRRGDLRVAEEADLERLHEKGQVETIKRLAQEGGGFADPDTIVSARSWDVARKAAGTSMAAVDAVLAGKAKTATCLIRPPGHHATGKRSMGFCLFNNIALAAEWALKKHDLSRILIVDWDVHHGNGTQDLFYEREDVFFYSVHRYPFYPGSGSAEETGTGPGLGTTLNVPVAYGAPRDRYFQMFERGLEQAARKAKPELILVSAGFDAHEADPIGSLGLKSADFGRLTQLVQSAADIYCNGRIVSFLEGGYNVTALAESVEAHLDRLTSSGRADAPNSDQ